MSDRDLIDSAYSEIVKGVFRIFFEAFTTAKGDAAAERKAEDTFKAGIAHARYVRDRGIASLP